MSEVSRHRELDSFIDAPRYPEALKDLHQPVLILNLFAPLPSTYKGLRLLIGQAEGVFPVSQGKEMWRRMRLFDQQFPATIEEMPEGFRFGRTEFRNLPVELYEIIKPATRFSWATTRAEMTDPTTLIQQFNLAVEDYRDKEIVIIPPHATPLAPLVEAVEKEYSKTPHIAWFEEILYADDDVWVLETYQEGMPNRLGSIGGAI